MKKIIWIAAVALLAVTTLRAQEKGVKFESGTLTELLSKAAAGEKYLFVDVYTTWCGPCKYMAGRVFTQESVGNYFNRTFVNAKFDAEDKGEGSRIAKKYGVTAYPTFLVLDGAGNEVTRIVGGDEPAAFIKKVQTAVSKVQ